jgi:hypothetical protein
METSNSGNLITPDTDQADPGTYNPIHETVVVVEINEKTPLLLPRIRSFERFGLQRNSNYMSNPELVGLGEDQGQEGRSNNARKLSRHLTYDGGVEKTVPTAPLKVTFPVTVAASGTEVNGYDYSVSYPDIMKTISITGFGAVEV